MKKRLRISKPPATFRKTDGEIPLATHTVIQSATIPGCNAVRDATFRQIVRQWRMKQWGGFHTLKGRF